ncbi:MAG: alpha-amylase, partial [Acidobacteria bacterium]|nr:alpha-amylase [Acidobacteriota bacterium]
MKDTIPINAAMGWEAILTDENRHRLESHDLPKFLVKQRWFAGKSGIIESVRLVEWAPLEASHSFLSLIEVRLQGGAVDMYLLPLAMTASTGVEGLERTAPNMVIAPIIAGRTSGLLCDGSYDDRTCQSLFSLVENATEIRANHGRICGVRGKAFSMVLGNRQPPLPVRRGSAEQSNTSILYGEGFILKLFRRPEAGENPDCEIGRYLTENTRFERIPPFAGMLLHVGRDSSEPRTLAMLQGLVKNQGDGWTWSLEELRRYYQISAARQFPQQAARDLGGEDDTSLKPPSSFAASALGGYTDSAALLGRRTAELHLALATPT